MKVRIPFVVNPAGRWHANGYAGHDKDPDWSFMMDCADNGEEGAHDYQTGFIEVELPVPKGSVTVEGTAALLAKDALPGGRTK